MRVLLVEDEDNIRDVIKLNLTMEGYEVITAASGSQAVSTCETQRFDVIVLDVMIPELDGFQVCEQLRLRNIQTPIIFLTAKDSPSDRIMGLKKGGDDYLTKPFVLEELFLRIKNLVKRNPQKPNEENSIISFGQNTVDFTTYSATNKNGSFLLTKKETLLLKLLYERRNKVVSRQEILQFVWGYDVYPSTRTIDNFILSFRKYFEEDSKHPKFFISVRGVGYKFIPNDK